MTSTTLTDLYLWVGQPHDEPEHLLMMLTAGDDGEQVYRPLMAISRDHADQLAPVAQQAADSLGVPAALRHYTTADDAALEILLPDDAAAWVDTMHGDTPEPPDAP